MPTFPDRFHALKTTVTGWYRGPKRALSMIITALAVAGTALGIGFGMSGGKPAPVRHSPPATIAPVAAKTSRCPLTDAPPSVGDTVPRRPALLVKIGNEPNARPQSGLNEADVVFDTPAEGFIMRYVAVFQCSDAAAIGPTRSVRWVDWNMVAREFVSPILAFAGGIDPNVNGVTATPWISSANLLAGGQAAGHRISSRSAPDNLYTSTTALFGLYPSKDAPPPAIFNFGAKLPSSARPAKAIQIDFSGGTDVIWKWDPKSHTWLHTYLGAPDLDTMTGKQVATSNIVVEIAHYSVGPYIESAGGSGDIESQLIGRGSGYVLRQGAVVPITWHRPFALSPMTFTDPAGQPVTLIPGRTWVEIVPSVQAAGIAITP